MVYYIHVVWFESCPRSSSLRTNADSVEAHESRRAVSVLALLCLVASQRFRASNSSVGGDNTSLHSRYEIFFISTNNRILVVRIPAAVLEHELNARLVSSPSPLVSLLTRYSKNVVFGIRCEWPTREVQLHMGTQVSRLYSLLPPLF